MATYAMALKESKNSNGIVFKTEASSYKDALMYFSQLKQMPKEEFNKIFIDTEIKTKKNGYY